MKTIVLSEDAYFGTLLMLGIEQVETPSMCAEFDPYAGELYTQVKMIDFKKNEIREIEWKELKEMLNEMHKNDAPKALKIDIWRVLQDITPYKELTAIGQRRRDEYKGEYPNLYSKYAKDIPIEELEELYENRKMAYGQNLNDWTMYNESWRGDTESSRRERKSIMELGAYIDIRKDELTKTS